ncbi:MAG: ClpXP protease specificity-enhancing factor [Candidatus Accumulibacter sp.]|jgi:stringent starvation protein B|nr:ClpXP protease specificity-enhancing factor [Accumulibacter sp.]
MNENLPSTKPYLIRAIHEWCCDSGFTPFITIYVDERVNIPRGYAQDERIVLNVSHEATGGLRIGNDLVSFKTRFGGVAHDVSFPVGNVIAIHARENGAGMSFDVEIGNDPEPPDDAPDPAPRTPPPAGRPKLQRIK